MAETTFGVSYEGPALDDGRMPVRELAPALLALGELFTEASTTLYPDRPPVALDIHATRKGSFSVDLILTAADGAWEATEQLFGGDGVTALVNLKDIVLGSGTVSLIEFIRWLRGRPIESEAPVAIDEPGLVKVTVDQSGTSIEVPQAVVDLHKKVTVRRSAREIVQPLTHEGIECFKATTESEVTVSVGKEDLPAFEAIEPPEEEEELQDTERETTVRIVAIAWNEGNKWRFSEGADDSSFFATIEDAGFLDGIDRGVEPFYKGDMLECTLRTRQRKVGSKLDVEYQIVNVKNHIRVGGEQLNLGGGEPDADAA
jgi:hypothetical protein